MSNVASPRISFRLLLLLAASAMLGCAGGMNQTTSGTLAGGTLGAGLGAIIGSTTGHTGPGIAIGAAAGAIGGALMGSTLDAEDRRTAQARAEADRQEEELERNRRLLEELRRKGADARLTDQGVMINLPDVLFDFNRSGLTSEARETVAEIATVLRREPDRSIDVAGHTDSVGSDEYNQRLSEERAESVADELHRAGVAPVKMRVAGFGETRPVASNSSDAGRARNRRVEILVR